MATPSPGGDHVTDASAFGSRLVFSVRDTLDGFAPFGFEPSLKLTVTAASVELTSAVFEVRYATTNVGAVAFAARFASVQVTVFGFVDVSEQKDADPAGTKAAVELTLPPVETLSVSTSFTVPFVSVLPATFETSNL
jgi:hypothetical protein